MQDMMAHSTYAPPADYTIIITTVLLQFIIRILRGGTKIAKGGNFQQTKWSQGELIRALFWFWFGAGGTWGENDMTAHLMQQI